ncbi:MAG: hypothetical protein NT049_02200 [Planctomycetota bacterium]|nr:hypothetical protein [Planctomycetota bacterium]
MTILIVPVFIAMSVLAVLAWQAVRKGVLTLRGWAAAALAISALASFPLSVISSAYLAIVPVDGCELASWIREVWKAHGWAAAFLWVIGGAAGLLAKGAWFPTRRSTVKAVAVACAVMLPLTLLDAIVFRGLKNFEEPLALAEAVSPDGRRRATAFRTPWLDAACFVELEANEPHPLLSRKLGAAGFDGDRNGLVMRPGDLSYNDALRRNSRLTWTHDGQALVLRFAGAPVVAYDLPRGTVLEASMFSGRGESVETREKDRQASLKAAVERLVAEHGGEKGE